LQDQKNRIRIRCLRSTILMGLLLLMLPQIDFSLTRKQKLVVTAEVNPSQTGCSTSFTEWRVEVVYDVIAEVFSEITALSSKDAVSLVRLIRDQELKQGVDIFRILAFIDVESNGNLRATSPVGALGLMQIMPNTGRFIAKNHQDALDNKHSLLEMERNVTYGVWYYTHLLQSFQGNEHAAIAAYNWGPGHIKDRQKRGHRLPRAYPGKVFAAEKLLREKVYERAKVDFWRRAGEYDCLCGHAWDSCRP